MCRPVPKEDPTFPRVDHLLRIRSTIEKRQQRILNARNWLRQIERWIIIPFSPLDKLGRFSFPTSEGPSNQRLSRVLVYDTARRVWLFSPKTDIMPLIYSSPVQGQLVDIPLWPWEAPAAEGDRCAVSGARGTDGAASPDPAGDYRWSYVWGVATDAGEYFEGKAE